MVVQSRATGRFLLKCVDGEWMFPSILDYDHDQPIVYLAMEELARILDGDAEENDWMLEFIADDRHQIFHLWVDGEPSGEGQLEWCSLFMFPEKTASIVSEVFSNHILLEKSLDPNS